MIIKLTMCSHFYCIIYFPIAQNQGMTTEPPITTQSPPLEGSFENPASSCSDIPQNSPSGEYWIKNNSTNSPVQVYCDMNRTCSCNNITGGWMRVASLDMSDPNQQCPDGFELMTSPIRTCIRPRSNSSVRAEQSGCVSTTYPTNGVEYSHVCGKIVGYQYGPTAAFESYIFNLEYGNTIDEQYVTGVSLTHGQSPREHIWTFQASISLSTSSMDG